MPNPIRLVVQGLREVQRANEALVRALHPTGARGRMIKRLTTGTYQTMRRYAHKDTGAMQSAILYAVTNDRGQVFINPLARNPRSRQLVTDYARYENARGGPHAFIDLTLDQMDMQARDAVQVMLQELG